MYIYVHYKDQLFRNMRYLHKIRNMQGIKKSDANNAIVFDLAHVSIMRLREDASQPCNMQLLNDDQMWMTKVVDLVQCVPPYWRNTFLGYGNDKLVICNSTRDLAKAAEYFPLKNTRFKAESAFDLYVPPCNQMSVMANTNNDQFDDPSLLKLLFRFRFVEQIIYHQNISHKAIYPFSL